MLFKKIGLVDEKFEYRENMYVGTEGDKISYISDKAPEDETKYGAVYGGSNKVLMPGFVNAHAHNPMSLTRGYGENLPLDRWLNELIYPFEDQLYDDGVYWATSLSLAESLRFGIVSSSDMYFFTDAVIKAVTDTECKSNVSRCVANPFGAPINEVPGFIEMCESIKQYQGKNNGKIIMEAAPHAEYSTDEPTIRAIAEFAKEYNCRVHVHVCETESEVQGCIDRHGVTPVEYFNNCGLFDQPANAAHCVWLNDNDRSILREKGVSVSSNPICNLKLVSGICDVNSLWKAGVNVAIGTDGTGSNNALNFMESVKMFALLGKYKSGNPAAMTPQDVLYSATRAGALAQGREDCGIVKEGYKADLIVIDMAQPNMQPIHHVLNNLIYSADGKDVALTMVDGKVMYKDGEYTTIDVEKAIAETNVAKDKMLAGVKVAQ